MRLPSSTLVLSFIVLFSLFPFAFSIHPHALSRREHRRSPVAHVLTSRQHHVTRDLLDVCINADVGLLADASQLLGLNSTVHLCLCLKDLDLYLETNDDAQALVGLFGKNKVSALITALINTSPDARQCTFPANAHHTCNNSDPCHYECDTNYAQNGDACVCALPNISCNGVCGNFSKGCGSAAPSRKREEVAYTLTQAQARCKPHETVCGIPGQVGTLAFECVDVRSAKDSCGGCVVPHSFPQSSVQPLGKECTSISNVKRSGCSEKRCIVHSCNEGWMPSPTKGECIRSPGSSPKIRLVKKRSDPLAANVTANANINSDLLNQLIAIIDGVLDVSSLASSSAGAHASTSSTSTTNAASLIYALFDDTIRVSRQLLSSSTVSQLESNTSNLLDTCLLLSSMLQQCECGQALGLTDAHKRLQGLIATVSTTRNWYTHNAIVPGCAGSAEEASCSNNASDQPIVLGFSSLLSDLGLVGNSGATVNGLGDTLSGSGNDVLNDVFLGPDNYKRDDVHVHANATVSSDLVAQIVALVNFVIKLQHDAASSTGSASSPSLTSNSASPIAIAELLDPIVLATAHLVTADTVAPFVSAAESLVLTSECAINSLGSLGLGDIKADLDEIITAALQIQTWCREIPVIPPAAPSSVEPTAPVTTHTTPSSTSVQGTPIVIGLSDLLTSLKLLGPAKANVTVDGFGSGWSNTVNHLLNGLGIGPADTKRQDGSSSSAIYTINTELRNQLEGLFDIVLGLEDSMSSLPDAESTSSTSLNDQSVLGVAHAMGHLLQSTTVSALLFNIDVLIITISTLQDQFTTCACMEALGIERASDLLNLLAQAAAGLKAWCASNTIVNPTPADPSASSLGSLLPTGVPMVVAPHAAPIPTLSASASSHPMTSGGSSFPAGDIPIVIGLNDLLDQLGLGGVSDATSHRRSSIAAKRTVIKRQDLMWEREVGWAKVAKRQVAANAGLILDSDLLTQIDALVSLVLGLSDAARVLPPASASSASVPLVTAKPVLPSAIPVSAPSGLAPVPPSIISTSSSDFCVVENIINATIALLSCRTYEDFVARTDALLVESLLLLETLQAGNLTQGSGLAAVYPYLIDVVETSLALQAWCRSHRPTPSGYSSGPSYTPTIPASVPEPTTGSSSSATSGSSSVASTSTDDEALVLALTKLLNGLGISVKVQAVVDGLLGNTLDHTVNSVLNTLGIGPNGVAKRRYTADA